MRIRDLLKIAAICYGLGIAVFVITLATVPAGYPWRDDMISHPPWFNEAYQATYIAKGLVATFFLVAAGLVLTTFSAFFYCIDNFSLGDSPP